MGRRELQATLAVSLAGAAGAAGATIYTATLTEVRAFADGITTGAVGNVATSTATWTYDSGTRRLTQTGGIFNVRFATGPTTTLYRLSVTGLVMGNDAPAGAATFACTEGNFGSGIGANLCGNYSFGLNFLDESTTTWGPGTAVARTLGGDDMATGAPLGVGTLDGIRSPGAYSGQPTLVLSNATCTGTCTTLPAGAHNRGQTWTLTTVYAGDGATDDQVTVESGVPTDIQVLGNDYTYPLNEPRLSVTAPPNNGGTAIPMVGNDGLAQWVRYTSAPGFVGEESFSYRVISPAVYDDTAVVTITVVDTTTDTDGDSVPDFADNCRDAANASQCDSDNDGHGNHCDGDLDNNDATNAQDTVLFRAQLGEPSTNPAFNPADINCNGAVNAQDTTLYRQLLGLPPGP